MKLFNKGQSVLMAFLFLCSCVSEQVEPQIDCQTSPVEISITLNTSASCGNADGAFVVEASGGEPPYSFEASLGNNSSGSYTDVSAGVYTVEVTDSKGCANTIDVSVQNEEGVSIDQIDIEEAGCETNLGQIDVSVSGGIEPYTFSLDGASSQSNGSFTGLGSGTYELSVADSDGCEITQEVVITTGTSYQNSVSTIIETNCAISGCHNGSVSPDLRNFSSIQSSASRVKARTQNRSMPRGRTLTQEEIDLIACWVDDGALDN